MRPFSAEGKLWAKNNFKVTVAGIWRAMVRDRREGRVTTEETLEVIELGSLSFFFLKKNKKPKSFHLESEQ